MVSKGLSVGELNGSYMYTVHRLSDNHINILFEKIYMYTVKPHMYMYAQ